jgi:beta-glucosidase
VARLSAAGWLIGLAAICTGSCIEHSDAVLNARFGAGISAPRYLTGMNPTEALPLQPVTTELGPDTGAAPLVDETGRSTCGDTPVGDLYTTDPEGYRQAQRLLFQMTIDQKVTQLTGVPAPPTTDSNRYEDIQRSQDDEELGLAGFKWRDGPHGVNLEAGQGRHALLDYSTAFPTTVSQGATFDLDLIYRVGEAIGDEVVATHNDVILAPCMNILRNPLWGRAQETFGEDSYHLGRVATALTLGLQTYISGCAKHYLGNNIEEQRFSINAQMDEQTLREIYGRHFEMVVRDGGVGCVMASYNSVNGKKSTQNKHTLTDVLRYDFGFRGFVLTDWWAMPGAHSGQGPVDPPQDLVTAAEALEAGLNVEMPWAVNFDAIPALVADGTVSQKVVDESVLRVLEQKLRFKSAYVDPNETYGLRAPTSTYDDVSGALVGTELAAHSDLAREVAEKAAVLLKNDDVGGKKALPISGVSTVAVIGAIYDYKVRSDKPSEKVFNFATDAALGDRGSSRVRPDPSLVVGPLAGITAAAQTQGIQVVSGATADVAANAEVAIVIVGLTAGDEGEEYTGAGDRESLALPAVHNDLVASVAALGKPTVVIVEAGGVVDMPWRNDVDAIVMAWYPGERAGEALARLLFGQANFAGRLPVTWPTSLDQFPAFSEGDTTVMDYYLGYRWFDERGLEPLYAFGYGLSYSAFEYERLHIPCADVSSDGLIQIEVDVRNVAGPAGDEVVQVYASYPDTTARRSVKELKGFARIRLEPGEGKRVNIPLRIRDLKYWDMNVNDWVIEKGPVLLQVGPSSDNLPLSQTVTVN